MITDGRSRTCFSGSNRFCTARFARWGTPRAALFADTLTRALGPQSPCTLLPAEAGWCAILRVPQIMSDEAWAATLLTQDRVLVQPGYFFDLDMGATLVLSLIVEEAAFAEGVARLVARVSAG